MQTDFTNTRNRVMLVTLTRLGFLKLNDIELVDSSVHFVMKKPIEGVDSVQEEEEVKEGNLEDEGKEHSLEGIYSYDNKIPEADVEYEG
eukprot:snap_masked-scaffold_15-processed-gene-1.28-mRNA-1 protein AED:1.00 eAED:1.00 QI:0/-1/0/0/-1/1/1/0/88